jgi:hypothetical protein
LPPRKHLSLAIQKLLEEPHDHGLDGGLAARASNATPNGIDAKR